MSHYTVAVFSRSPGELNNLLEPYCECVESGSSYAEFYEDEDGEYDESQGKRGYWTNPCAKWDWWELGGRWRGTLKLKEGRTGKYGEPLVSPWDTQERKDDPKRCDQALVADCIFSDDLKAYTEALRTWEILVENSPLREGENESDYFRMYKPEYYIKRYGTKENYARSQAMFNTYAFVTASGEWNETGEMGWFGYDGSTVESRKSYQDLFIEYLKEAEAQGLYISIVDAHI